MAKESIDSGLSSEQSQTSRSNYPTRQQQPHLPIPLHHQPSAERITTQTHAVVNSSNYRMFTGGGINPNNGQNPPPINNTTTSTATGTNLGASASSTALFSRFPSQALPRVHFGDPKGRKPRFREPSDCTRIRVPPPFVRSLSSKVFDLTDGLSPPPVQQPSSPQHEMVYHQPQQHRDTLMDKGIQCEPESGGSARNQPHSNPLLSALLAAANATVNTPSGSGEVDPGFRRKPQFRSGTLPYWSDSEVNAYDSLDTYSAAPQNTIGIVGGGNKAYPSASFVAAAATAAAMALAAVQSTSRVPAPKTTLDPSLGTPMSRASLHLEDLTPESVAMRSLTGQFADTSLYARFPTATGSGVDQRKSVNFDATSLQKLPDFYGNPGVDITQFPPPPAPNPQLMDKNNQKISIGPQYFHELPGSQIRYSVNEESSLMQPPHFLTGAIAGSSQERTLSGTTGPSSVSRPQLPSNFNSAQFNFLSSEPYPSLSQPQRQPIQTQSPVHEPTSPRFRQHSHLDGGDIWSGGGLLVTNIIAASGLKTAQMPLRDLYCVLETDSIRKARSMIRTGTDYFEWDEVFEMEIEESRFLSILIYQWDARTRHRLCFYGGIDLTSITQRQIASSPSQENPGGESAEEAQPLTSPLIARSGMRFEKIALQLEPRGVLYLQTGFLPMSALYIRRNLSTSYDSAFFGVSLDELMYRERMLASLGIVPDSVVPLLIRKCVEEVDRRGTEVVGIYRLSGSVWMKMQVRDLFNRTAEKIAQALVKRNEKAVRGALAGLDLSVDAVPDIHAITATMKDFFRELPEPLFTNALYPMVYEATQVAGPGDSHMGTKLILNILDCLPTSNQVVGKEDKDF
ncbi:unnamed protein product [Rodentolepis nana]|uniref:Rho-GAP domain-containing protein n=1 Tax=Rodentolepis nana TaxID=102285 RepID=A0A0R3T1T3_RODNA|nr:unnamed protein product [Rodentolepis nana]